MRSLLPPAAYIDQAWFERERTLLFEPLWQFFGLKTMLRKPNDFVVRRLGDVPVVVQNFSGQLRAFENLCVHRKNPLQTQPQGNRPLVCGYHGWGYDSEGIAANIPFERELYRYPDWEKSELKLHSFPVEVVGNLVFISLSQQPPPLTAQFDAKLLASLTEVSEAFDDETIITTLKLNCNWKLAYENLRDSHHPRYVHSQSLYKNVKFGVDMTASAIADARQVVENGFPDQSSAMRTLRSFSNGGLNEPMESLTAYAWHQHVERYGELDWYYNWLVFPNLHVASGSGGYSFIIEHHVPVSASRTDLIVYYVTGRKRSRYATSASVLREHMLGGGRVLREDIRVMENIQSALHKGATPARLGEYEYANATIERWYTDVMNGTVNF